MENGKWQNSLACHSEASRWPRNPHSGSCQVMGITQDGKWQNSLACHSEASRWPRNPHFGSCQQKCRFLASLGMTFNQEGQKKNPRSSA
jgi:hypothetical protein